MIYTWRLPLPFSLHQRSRIKYHLDQLIPERWVAGLNEPSYFANNNYSPEIELIVVGDLTIAPPPVGTAENDFLDGPAFYQGVLIAQPQSILWGCEVCDIKMNPINVDASLFVQSAGKVKLRGDEIAARDEMYQRYREKLAGTLGFPLADYSEYVSVPLHGNYRSSYGFSGGSENAYPFMR
jgi:hypothetical protein